MRIHGEYPTLGTTNSPSIREYPIIHHWIRLTIFESLVDIQHFRH